MARLVAVAPEPSHSVVQSGSSRARRILVVDDNTDAAEMLAALLTMDGHDVRTASTGPDALAIVTDFHPHLAFLDIGLPGMSGYELARRLRADRRLAGLTMVAVTGWGQDEDRRQSREAGFDQHLTKPVDPREVQALVAQTPG
ncbi:MAG: response regulator [Acidobacteriota bacterium]|nr:response regulator [Acidobacteriota bacterium]